MEKIIFLRKSKKSNTVLQFLKKKSLNEILSKVAAVDGMAITAISKSQAIAGYVQQKRYEMPNSPTTISKCNFIKKNVLNFGKILKN